MSLLIYLGLLISSVFIFITRPLSLGLLVIGFSLVLTVILGITVRSWWGLILFLVYVGALLVLFVYVIAMSPNCFFSRPKKRKNLNYVLIGLMIIIFTVVWFMPDSLFFTSNKRFLERQKPLLLDRFYNISCLVSLSVVLLLAMVAVVYLIPDKRQGAPLRPFE